MRFSCHICPITKRIFWILGAVPDEMQRLSWRWDTAVDGSEEICKAASEYLGTSVRCMLFQELNEENIYNGIWACASILHLPKQELPDVICKMRDALKKDGVVYTSFKYGDFEGERNGRYFTYFTEESFRELLSQIPGLQTEKLWITGDVREGRGDECWLNVILRRC